MGRGATAQLYECRDAARFLLGDRYAERMRELGRVIRATGKKHDEGDLRATMRLAKDAPGMAQVQILAAYVEMIEPSQPEGA